MSEVKPITTAYKGCLFRSRLEARWAVFFDALGIPWEHEPEVFETPHGRYLPDFRIRVCYSTSPNKWWTAWFEVRRSGSTQDLSRERAVGSHLWSTDGEGLYLLRGLPRLSYGPDRYGITRCESGPRLAVEPTTAHSSWSFNYLPDELDFGRVGDAVTKTKSARFEFGACG